MINTKIKSTHIRIDMDAKERLQAYQDERGLKSAAMAILELLNAYDNERLELEEFEFDDRRMK